MLWNRYLKRPADLEADHSFVEDVEQSADYRRWYATYLLERELSEALFVHREQLMATATQ
jgi:hypothetical protein